jgi:Fe-S-cluster-containing hydrogenase component 2
MSPLTSLQQQSWFKLICGASYQHLPTIRNLALVYSLAGADCIDMAADPAVIRAARAGMEVAAKISAKPLPWLMISCNDGEDPHFRKASFEQKDCLTNCDRPCEKICPTNAIQFSNQLSSQHLLGNSLSNPIIESLCYGCGRCLPICPVQIIQTKEQVYLIEELAADPVATTIDAIEIHTQSDRLPEFKILWQRLQPLLPRLQLISISFPDAKDLEKYLQSLLEIMQPLSQTLIWQTDGRPMSGDIGKGASRAALHIGQKVLDFDLSQGYVQLAGGTNDYTIVKAKELKLAIAGIAFGSYARQLVAEVINLGGDRLEESPELLWQAVGLAQKLIEPLKTNP